MKYSIALIVAAFALVVSVSAAPQTLTTRIAAIRDCGGPLAQATVNGTIKTDPIKVPGTGAAEVTLVLKVATPDLLRMKKTLTRKRDNYQVPCLSDNFTGSCDVNFCQTIIDTPELICPLLPSDVPCECPFKAATYYQPNGVLTFNVSPWNEIQGGFAGDYTEQLDFTGLGITVGCVQLDFTLVAA